MTAYATARREARDAMDPREYRGLPAHPDGSGWATCPDCDGIGAHTHNDTNPYGYGPDPQCDYDVDCDRCSGTGQLCDGRGPDPLIELRNARSYRRLLDSDRFAYTAARLRSMSPVRLPRLSA